MAFTLTMLGTDTNFPEFLESESINDSRQLANHAKFYPRAESLGFAALMIQPGAPTPDSVPYDSATEHLADESQMLIDGPSTLGSEVGERVAAGVKAILEAVARGETEINIMAHSRGACESILIAHEIRRIQKRMARRGDDEAKIAAIRTESPCTYTKAAMSSSKFNIDHTIRSSTFQQKIRDVNISMLAIDPVPGGSVLAVGRGVKWDDDRFYKLPKCVKHYEQYVYMHERSRGFKPIVPKNPQRDGMHFSVQPIPGNHGSGSGNPNTQTSVRPPEGHARDVQELMILNLVCFMKQHGTQLKAADEIEGYRGLVKDEQKGAYDQIFPAGDPEKNEQALIVLAKELLSDDVSDDTIKQKKLAIYKRIMDNKSAYEFLSTYAYFGLTKEQSIQWLAGRGYRNDRIIHLENKGDTFLRDAYGLVMHDQFVNAEHAQLVLEQKFNIKITSDDKPQAILDQIKGYIAAASGHIESAGGTSPTASALGDAVPPLIGTDEGKKLIAQAVSYYLMKVSESVLSGTVLQDDIDETIESVLVWLKTDISPDSNMDETFRGVIRTEAIKVIKHTAQAKAEQIRVQSDQVLSVKPIDTIIAECVDALNLFEVDTSDYLDPVSFLKYSIVQQLKAHTELSSKTDLLSIIKNTELAILDLQTGVDVLSETDQRELARIMGILRGQYQYEVEKRFMDPDDRRKILGSLAQSCKRYLNVTKQLAIALGDDSASIKVHDQTITDIQERVEAVAQVTSMAVAREQANAAVAAATAATEKAAAEAARDAALEAKAAAVAEKDAAEAQAATLAAEKAAVEAARAAAVAEKDVAEAQAATLVAEKAAVEAARAAVEAARAAADVRAEQAETARAAAEAERAAADVRAEQAETARAAAEAEKDDAETSAEQAETARNAAKDQITQKLKSNTIPQYLSFVAGALAVSSLAACAAFMLIVGTASIANPVIGALLLTFMVGASVYAVCRELAKPNVTSQVLDDEFNAESASPSGGASPSKRTASATTSATASATLRAGGVSRPGSSSVAGFFGGTGESDDKGKSRLASSAADASDSTSARDRTPTGSKRASRNS